MTRRIRQVKPEFFADAVVSAWPPAARLFYIGLWTVADDAGWFEWALPEIGASLYPYETPRKRLVDMERSTTYLVGSGRLILHECGCANIPTLPAHQRVAGNQTFKGRDRHRSHTVATSSDRSLAVAPDRVGNGRERNGEERRGMTAAHDAHDDAALRSPFDEMMLANGVEPAIAQGLTPARQRRHPAQVSDDTMAKEAPR